ncbi:MAG TPA: CHAT domain-containing protein [Tahibacter sp.]|nr:CHAT domain-containing protein [Tahibacter sp.]
MSEINLILSASATGASVTAVAVADSGTGVGTIAPEAIAALRDAKQKIVAMMSGQPRMTSNDLVRFGRLMGDILFCGDVRPTWMHASSGRPLITKILATTTELKAIPWEYAAWPSGQAGPVLANSVVRLVPQSQAAPPAPLKAADGLRVLLLSASPLNLDAIPWQDIRDELIGVFDNALPDIEVVGDDDVPATNRFLRVVDAASPKKVRDSLRRDDPHVVHFIGHGTDKGLALIDPKTRKSVVVDATAFGAALQAAPSVRLAVLSACDTANASLVAPVDESVGTFAEQLVANAVPAVIASQTVIDKRTIATFCEGLYATLLSSGSIDVAVAAGRCEVAAQLGTVQSAAIEWGIPVLYRRLGAAQLFDGAAP